MTTGTSPKTDTAADSARAQGGRRPSFRHAHRRRDRPPDAPSGDRRVADQGQEDRAVPRAATTSSSRRSATSATCRAAPPTSRPSTRASRGRASAWTSTTSSSRSTSSRRRRRARSPSCATRSRASTSSASPRTRTARARPSPGTCSRPSSPRCPVAPDGLPRDHRAGHPGRRGEPARPRPGPRRRPGDPPHPRPALRLRGLPGAVEEGHAEAVGGPGAVGGHPDHRAARARADGVRRRRLLGHRRDAGRRRERDAAHVRRPRWSPSTATGSPPAATSARDGQLRGRRRRVLDEGSARRLAEALHGRDLRRHLGRGEAVHAQAVRAVHDLDAAAGGRPQAALLRRADDAHRAAAVRERLHHLHAYRLDHAVGDGDQRRPRRRPASSTATSTSRRRRGSTPARSRTRRRRTRRSGRPARRSAPPARSPARSTATSSGSTS